MFGWVDFSESERKRANEVLALVKYPGAIDELGVGVLRDGFANRFFPGTSTLHTHARYYFFVAYLMKYLEQNFLGRPLGEIREAFRAGEKDTGRRLRDWYNSRDIKISGITGLDYIDTDRWVKQTPTAMTWATVQRYGLLADSELKLNGFFSALSNVRTKYSWATEEDDENPELTTGLWRFSEEDYKYWTEAEELSFNLSMSEAQILSRAINKCGPETLYSYFIQDLDVISSSRDISKSYLETFEIGDSFVAFADNVSLLCPDLNKEERKAIQNAANLSALTALLHTRFNYILREKAGVLNEENPAVVRWNKYYESNESPYLKRALACDFREIFKAASDVDLGNSRNRLTYEFLSKSRELLEEDNLEELDNLIRNREVALKGKMRSKIENADIYAKQWFGGTELIYRLDYALNLSEEIAQGLLGGQND